jgi:hypothetical protein
MVDEEVCRLLNISCFTQMTPTLQNLCLSTPAHNLSSGYYTMPYSPIGTLPHNSFISSPLHLPQMPSSPCRQQNSFKKMTKEQFETSLCQRLEDRAEIALKKVDSGLEYLQRELQVKERLR